ncbi:hypothetical protein DSO57_1005822 [Entomophthora muscae]|uniref:Uncharacterized protein n=1 Tax=Entomophthora muscae TaxID=34485 RepID=A0ACC2TIT1_9FUNG|nr:hypothetical protein DSO57_1005822 [Entomophthora muscae]
MEKQKYHLFFSPSVERLAFFLKFVAFTLAPALVMVWNTSPDLQRCIPYSFHHPGSNLTQFTYKFEDIPGPAQEILAIREKVVRILSCDNLELSALESVSSAPPGLAP